MVTIVSHNETDGASDYEHLTPRMALDLAAPHTWVAAVLPSLAAVACASAQGYPISISLAIVLMMICILMQSATNTFNDYYDYVKGSDTADDDVDPTDAVLVYNNVNPKTALTLAVGFLATAFVLGAYVIWLAGWIPLALGVIAAFVVVLYSAGKTPISYLPIGELTSGFVMGGMIPLACYQALTRVFDPIMLVWALPTIITVGLIMLTNNTCDIEKDIEAGRKTLPVLLGRKTARNLYHALLALCILMMFVNVLVWYRSGWVVLVFMLAASIPLLKAMLANPLAPNTRIAGMSQICSLNICLGAFYAAAIFSSTTSMLIM